MVSGIVHRLNKYFDQSSLWTRTVYITLSSNDSVINQHGIFDEQNIIQTGVPINEVNDILPRVTLYQPKL